MRIAYSDPTARWVPFVGVVFMSIAAWFGALFSNVNIHNDVQRANTLAVALFVILTIGVFLQGRLFWTGSVDSISIVSGQAEAVTMCWVGSGKRYTFGPADTSDWKATSKHDNKTKVSNVYFKIRGGEPLSISFLSPKVLDLDLLATLAPAFFAQLRKEYPTVATRIDSY